MNTHPTDSFSQAAVAGRPATADRSYSTLDQLHERLIGQNQRLTQTLISLRDIGDRAYGEEHGERTGGIGDETKPQQVGSVGAIFDAIMANDELLETIAGQIVRLARLA